MEQLTDKQRKLLRKRNKAARFEARNISIKGWYFWNVEVERTFKEKQLIHLDSVIQNNHVTKSKKNDHQNTWRNLVNR